MWIIAKEILGVSANGYSVVQLGATWLGAEMLNFGLGATGQGWVHWMVKMVCAAESAAEGLSRLGGLWPISGISEAVQWSRMIAGWFEQSECPSCHKLMTICYKKGSRGGIQSDSLHSGSSHQLRAFFLMKVCFCAVNDLWQGLKCIALTMPTHFEHSK